MDIESGLDFDEIDRKLLHVMQNNFPVSTQPFFDIAVKIGITEEKVLTRIKHLCSQGIIRRIGASINSRNVGYKSTLVALMVEEDCIFEVAKAVNGFPGVTHNYLRDGEYNMWFTIIAPSQTEITAALDTIRTIRGVVSFLTLPAKKIFKINAEFSLMME